MQFWQITANSISINGWIIYIYEHRKINQLPNPFYLIIKEKVF